METLIIEDDVQILRMLEEYMPTRGHNVTTCLNIETALEHCRQTYYPLIMLDLSLPGIHGVQFCHRLRTLQKEPGMVLVITANDRLEDLQAVLDAGADDYLVKPVHPDVLRTRFMILERQFQQLLQHKLTEQELKECRQHFGEFITEHAAYQQTEDALLKSERWLDAILNSIGEGVIATDQKGNIMFMNPIAEHLTGWKQTEVLGREIAFDLIHQETRIPLKNPAKKAIQENIRFDLGSSHLLIARDGTETPVDCKGAPIRDEIGNLAGIVLVFTDITARKRMEDELRQHRNQLELLVEARTRELKRANTQLQQEIAEREQAEKVLRQLEKAIETIRIGVTITNIGGKIMYTNPAEAKMHDYEVAELLDQDIGIFAPPELRKPIPLEQLRELGTMDRESVNIRKDRSIFPVRLISDVVKNVEGIPIAIVTICEDITERKHAERALQASEQLYRFLAENVADGIAIFQEAKLVFVNTSFCSIFGYTVSQLAQMNPLDLLRNDYKILGKERIQKLESDNLEKSWQAVCVTGDQREIWVEIFHNMIEWQEKPAVLLTIRDITERKEREMAIEKEKETLRKENITLKSTLKDRYKLGDIIGKSAAMQEVYELITSAAATDANVVIYGESGTGKELVAWTIHYLSDRKSKAFTPVNCGAIPETLFESEFFGYKKGAFTGANKDKVGFFDSTYGGTLFLDEVGELHPKAQVKLLRAIAGGGYTPIGDHAIKKTNVRIIAATNNNLIDMVKQGRMREDFFYRVHVIPITLPPLRERREDILLLIDYFLKHYSNQPKPPTLPGSVLEVLYNYNWPGNVRELQNVLQRYLATKQLDFLPMRHIKPVPMEVNSIAELPQKPLKLKDAVREFEKKYIVSMLEQHRWHKSHTANVLGIERKTLFRKMKHYGII